LKDGLCKGVNVKKLSTVLSVARSVLATIFGQDLAKKQSATSEFLPMVAGAGLSLRFTPLLRSFTKENASRFLLLRSLRDPATLRRFQRRGH